MADYGRRQAPLGELPAASAEAAQTTVARSRWLGLRGRPVGHDRHAGLLYGLSRVMRRQFRLKESNGTDDDSLAPADRLASMHHHFIDRFALGDSPIHRLDARAKLAPCWPTG